MSPSVPRGKTDPAVKRILEKLNQYQSEHPRARIQVYRQNRFSIRIRVIDPAFQKLSRSERARMVWPLLRELPDDTLTEVSMVLLIPPEEIETSMVSREFDDPLPSQF
ncbi:MAG TPA: hypothetical protein VN641_07885 [Urbifossiella sp.]|nr:hypothetical protein [Urbifossiella sp.]